MPKFGYERFKMTIEMQM